MGEHADYTVKAFERSPSLLQVACFAGSTTYSASTCGLPFTIVLQFLCHHPQAFADANVESGQHA